MKKSLTLLLVCFSLPTIADEFQAELTFEAAEFSYELPPFNGLKDSQFGISGKYYFETFNLDSDFWAESDFLNKNSSVSISHSQFDSFSSLNSGSIENKFTSLSLDYYGGLDNKLYTKLSIAQLDSDESVFDDDLVSLKLGYFINDNWLVAVEQAQSDTKDPLIISTKYVSRLSEQNGYGVELYYDIESKDLTLVGNYFLNSRTSFGVTFSELYDYGFEFNHFFSKNFSFNAQHHEGDVSRTSVGLSYRF